MEALAVSTGSLADTDGDGVADDPLVFSWSESSAAFRTTVVDAVADLTSSYEFELVELVEPAVIDLTVYGITGQKVATLARGWRAGGAHTLKWNGRDEAGRPMASGVYLYRLRAGVGVELTRRMLLLR